MLNRTFARGAELMPIINEIMGRASALHMHVCEYVRALWRVDSVAWSFHRVQRALVARIELGLMQREEITSRRRAQLGPRAPHCLLARLERRLMSAVWPLSRMQASGPQLSPVDDAGLMTS